MKNNVAYRAIIHKIISGEFKDDKDLTKVKLWACKKYGLNQFPCNSKILSVATDEEKEEIIQSLRLKPIRSISGVYIITVMPTPYPCPKDEPCIYCPGGPMFGTPRVILEMSQLVEGQKKIIMIPISKLRVVSINLKSWVITLIRLN